MTETFTALTNQTDSAQAGMELGLAIRKTPVPVHVGHDS